MINARELLQSVDRLSHSQRIRLLAGHARRMRGTAELGVLVDELAAGDSFSRDIAVFLARVGQDTRGLRLFLDDADGAVRAHAIKAWLLTGGPQHAEVAQLIEDASHATRHTVYSQLRRKARRQRMPGLADALVDAVRARFGDAEARRLLPACAPETVARLLPQLGAGGSWNATVVAHPSTALAEARRQLAELPSARRAAWWSAYGAGVLGAARTHAREVMDHVQCVEVVAGEYAVGPGQVVVPVHDRCLAQ